MRMHISLSCVPVVITALLLGTSAAHAATVTFDMINNPHSLPPSPWVNDDPAGINETFAAGHFYLRWENFTSSTNRGVYSYQEPFDPVPGGANDLDSTTIWHMRGRVRVDSFDPSSSDGVVWGMGMLDGTKAIVIGANLNNSNGNTRFFLADLTGGRYSSASEVAVPAGGDPFFDVELRRVGTGLGTDLIQLIVDGVVLTNNIPTYSLLPDFTFAPRQLRFGQFAPNVYGVARSTGLSYGFGEDAPALAPIPEPAAAISMLAVLGCAITMRRRRRLVSR